jgi:hypothetical protein
MTTVHVTFHEPATTCEHRAAGKEFIEVRFGASVWNHEVATVAQHLLTPAVPSIGIVLGHVWVTGDPIAVKREKPGAVVIGCWHRRHVTRLVR